MLISLYKPLRLCSFISWGICAGNCDVRPGRAFLILTYPGKRTHHNQNDRASSLLTVTWSCKTLLNFSYVTNYSIKEPGTNHDGNKKRLFFPQKNVSVYSKFSYYIYHLWYILRTQNCSGIIGSKFYCHGFTTQTKIITPLVVGLNWQEAACQRQLLVGRGMGN